MKEKVNKSFILKLLLCFVPFIISAVYYNKLPEQVAIHFDNAGTPDNYASKFLAAFGIPALMIVIYLYSWFRNETDPKKNSSETLRSLFGWFIPILTNLVHIFTISYAMGMAMNLSFYSSLILGLLFIIIGNYLPKCRQNYTLGIKLPWTLHDTDNWNKTHTLAGWLWIAGGFIFIANSFIAVPWLSISVIALLIAIPFLYSYSLHKRTIVR